jgi:hypothetical protein
VDSAKISDWVQIVASLGVIAGLLLVAYELNQDRSHAIGASIVSGNDATRLRYVTEIESGIADSFIKSFKSPDDLSDEEIFRLNSYLAFIVEQYGEWEALYEVGVLRYSGAENMDEDIRLRFTGRYGRAWYAAHRSWVASTYPKIAEKLDRELESRPIMESPPDIEAVRSQLSENDLPQ